MKLKDIMEGEALPTVKTPTVKQLATKTGIPQAVLRKAAKRGAKHELEHTKKKKIAREIAMDHIGEDPDYYEKLEKIEKH
jgi:hypothetical protein